MGYKINPAVFSSMLPIPIKLIDENIKLAGAVQLKTILFFFREATAGRQPTDAEIAEAIGYSEEDVQDALIFWEERGLVARDGDPISFPQTKEETVVREQRKNDAKSENQGGEKQSLPIVKPSFEQVAQRLKESEALQLLFREAQEITGKTIGFSGQSTLLMIHDSYGLPVDVILMLLGYAKSVGRSDWSYVSSLSKLWSDKEIFSIEQAEEFIHEQNAADELWRSFRLLSKVSNAVPTTKQRQYFIKWGREYKFSAQMIFVAYERSIEQTGKFSLPYTDKILKRWHSAGLKTLNEVAENEKAFAESRSKKKESEKKSTKSGGDVFSSDASYDISKYTGLGLNITDGEEE